MTQEQAAIGAAQGDGGSPLDALYGEAYVQLGDGRRVDVLKLKVRYVKRALELIASVFRRLHDLSGGQQSGDQLSLDLVASLVQSRSAIPVSAILQLISDCWEEAFALIRLHTTLSEEEASDLDIDDAVALIAAVIKRNASFFERTVVPYLIQLAAEVAGAVEEKAAQ